MTDTRQTEHWTEPTGAQFWRSRVEILVLNSILVWEKTRTRQTVGRIGTTRRDTNTPELAHNQNMNKEVIVVLACTRWARHVLSHPCQECDHHHSTHKVRVVPKYINWVSRRRITNTLPTSITPLLSVGCIWSPWRARRLSFLWFHHAFTLERGIRAENRNREGARLCAETKTGNYIDTVLNKSNKSSKFWIFRKIRDDL